MARCRDSGRLRLRLRLRLRTPDPINGDWCSLLPRWVLTIHIINVRIESYAKNLHRCVCMFLWRLSELVFWSHNSQRVNYCGVPPHYSSVICCVCCRSLPFKTVTVDAVRFQGNGAHSPLNGLTVLLRSIESINSPRRLGLNRYRWLMAYCLVVGSVVNSNK